MRAFGGLLLSALGCACPGTSSPAPPRSPPASRLFCHGGPGITVSSRYELHFGQVWSSYRDVAGHELMAELVVELEVTPAATPAGPSGERLPPGTCAFADRQMNASDPRRLRWEGPLQPGLTLSWRSANGVTTPPIITTPFDGLAGGPNVVFWGDVAVEGQALRISDFSIQKQ